MTEPGDEVADRARRTRIDSYEVVGRPPRSDLRALAGLAAQVCDVPQASINLATDSSQQVATAGSEPSGGPEASRFHGGCDLVAPDGVVIGSLTVRDARPRTLTQDQRAALEILADRVVDALEHGVCTRLLEQAQAEVAAHRDQMRRSAEQVAMLADRVSHDLRNPLTAVSMSLEMLGEQPSVAADEDAMGLVARALSGAQRIDGLIEELITPGADGGPGRA